MLSSALISILFNEQRYLRTSYCFLYAAKCNKESLKYLFQNFIQKFISKYNKKLKKKNFRCGEIKLI